MAKTKLSLAVISPPKEGWPDAAATTTGLAQSLDEITFESIAHARVPFGKAVATWAC